MPCPIRCSADPKGLYRLNRLKEEKQLNLHLSSEEIAGLLQSTTGDGPFGTANPQQMESARRHLDGCATCQMLMLAHEQANQRLALLKADIPGAKEPACPSGDVWLELTAGIPGLDSAHLIGHAAQCDHCGPLLRQAHEDARDEQTPEEANIIAHLSSSTRPWQEQLAARLHHPSIPVQGPVPVGGCSPSMADRLLGPWQLSFAAAIVGLVLLGLRDYQQIAGLVRQNHQANAEIARLQQNASLADARTPGSAIETRKTTAMAKTTEPAPRSNLQIASLTLQPGQVRGIIPLHVLAVPRGSDLARITLRLEAVPEGVVREELLDSNGEVKWNQELQPSEVEKNSDRLVLVLPGYILSPGDYQMRVSHRTPSSRSGRWSRR